MPSKTITISREQRDPLHRLVTQHISGIGDVDMKLSAGDFAAADRLGLEYSEDIRMLDDLGWNPEDPRQFFDLTLPGTWARFRNFPMADMYRWGQLHRWRCRSESYALGYLRTSSRPEESGRLTPRRYVRPSRGRCGPPVPIRRSTPSTSIPIRLRHRRRGSAAGGSCIGGDPYDVSLSPRPKPRLAPRTRSPKAGSQQPRPSCCPLCSCAHRSGPARLRADLQYVVRN